MMDNPDNAALVVSKGTVQLRQLEADRAWKGLVLWAQGDARFLPPFVSVEVIEDDGRRIRKRVTSQAGTDRANVSREQISIVHEGMLATHEYTDGPWFISCTGIEVHPSKPPQLYITTLRHTQHPGYQDPAAAGAAAGVRPPTAQQNAERVLGILNAMALEDLI